MKNIKLLAVAGLAFMVFLPAVSSGKIAAQIGTTAVSPSASLSLSANSYTISSNSSFTLTLTSNQPNKQFRLCSKRNGITNPCTSYMPTNSSGGYTWTGVWNQTNYAGNWEEWVEFQDPVYSSPHITFYLAQPVAPSATLYLSASSYTISSNSTFTLALLSNQQNKLFRLCSKQNSVTNPCTSYMLTDLSGGYAWTGVWDQASYTGSWEEWVEFQNPAFASPHITFYLLAE